MKGIAVDKNKQSFAPNEFYSKFMLDNTEKQKTIPSQRPIKKDFGKLQ